MSRIVRAWDAMLTWVGTLLYDEDADPIIERLAERDAETAEVERRIMEHPKPPTGGFLYDGMSGPGRRKEPPR